MIHFPVLAVDPTILVSIISTIGFIIAAALSAYVAINTNKKEKETTAKASIEKATDKVQAEKEELFNLRLQFCQEKIATLEQQKSNLEKELEKAYAKLANRKPHD